MSSVLYFSRHLTQFKDHQAFAAHIAQELRGKVFGFDPAVSVAAQRQRLIDSVDPTLRENFARRLGETPTFTTVITAWLLVTQPSQYCVTAQQFEAIENLARIAFAPGETVSAETVRAAHLLPDGFEKESAHPDNIRHFAKKFGVTSSTRKHLLRVADEKDPTYGDVLQRLPNPLSQDTLRRLQKMYVVGHLPQWTDEKALSEKTLIEYRVAYAAGLELDAPKAKFLGPTHAKLIQANANGCAGIASQKVDDFATAVNALRKAVRDNTEITAADINAALVCFQPPPSDPGYVTQFLNASPKLRRDAISDLTRVAYLAVFQACVDPGSGILGHPENYPQLPDLNQTQLAEYIAKMCQRSDTIKAPGMNESLAWMIAGRVLFTRKK